MLHYVTTCRVNCEIHTAVLKLLHLLLIFAVNLKYLLHVLVTVISNSFIGSDHFQRKVSNSGDMKTVFMQSLFSHMLQGQTELTEYN